MFIDQHQYCVRYWVQSFWLPRFLIPQHPKDRIQKAQGNLN